jgi:hypothetical protein
MTIAEASKVAGIQLNLDSRRVPESGRCSYAVLQPGIEGLHFMLDGDPETRSAEAQRIVRIEVRGNSQIATSTGAKIGDPEARIKALYPGQIEVTPHTYSSKGHYLTVVPKETKDRANRLIFETDGDRVTAFYSGKLPEVKRVEGCF